MATVELRLHVCQIKGPLIIFLMLKRWHRTKQTLILQTPGGLMASLATLALGWYSDKKVRFSSSCTVRI